MIRTIVEFLAVTFKWKLNALMSNVSHQYIFQYLVKVMKNEKSAVLFVYFFSTPQNQYQLRTFLLIDQQEFFFSAKFEHKKIDSWHFVKKNLRSRNFGGLDATNELFIRETHSVIHGCQPNLVIPSWGEKVTGFATLMVRIMNSPWYMKGTF